MAEIVSSSIALDLLLVPRMVGHAFTLGVSPGTRFSLFSVASLAGLFMPAVPSFSSTVDAVGIAACYGTAAYVLRGLLCKLILGLRHRRICRRTLGKWNGAATAHSHWCRVPNGRYSLSCLNTRRLQSGGF